MKKIFIYRKQVFLINEVYLKEKLTKNPNKLNLDHTHIKKKDFESMKIKLIKFKDYLISNINNKNYSKMLKYLEYLNKNNLVNQELFFHTIFEKINFKKKNERVFYNKDKYTYPNIRHIWLLYLYAKINNISLCRLCLHKSDKNKINSMIMIHTNKQIVGPLKQKKKYIEYHILFGYLQISLIQKSRIKIFKLNIKGDHKNLSIPANVFRTIESFSSPAIFLEIAEGPFKDSDTIWRQ